MRKQIMRFAGTLVVMIALGLGACDRREETGNGKGGNASTPSAGADVAVADLQAAQGVWKLSATQSQDRNAYKWPIKQLVITGGKYTANSGYAQLGDDLSGPLDDTRVRKAHSGEISLIASSSPKQCTFTGFGNGPADKPRLALYDVTKDMLRICMFSNTGRSYAGRPGQLEPANGVIVYIFTR